MRQPHQPPLPNTTLQIGIAPKTEPLVVVCAYSVPAKLKEKRAEARAARLTHNRAVTCARCKVEDAKPATVSIRTNTS